MNEWLTPLTQWLTDLLVLGTALLLVSCAALLVLRQPVARMAVARGTLLALAMLTVLTALPMWPRQPLEDLIVAAAPETEDRVLPAAANQVAVHPETLRIDAAVTDEAGASSPPTKSTSAPSVTKLVSLLPLFWLGSVVVALAYIILGAFRAFRLLHGAAKAPAWSQQELARLVAPKSRLPRLKTSERIATAVALLAWRPHILLAEASVREENKAAVRAALAHEWAHIRHGDLWCLALERLLLPVFWLHPLFWLLRRQIRSDQELLADAAAAGDARVQYAEALMIWAKAETGPAPRLGLAALPLWENPSSLSRRIEMLLHAKSPLTSRGSRLWKWLAPLALVAAVLGLSLFTLRPAAIAQDDSGDSQAQPRPEKIKKAKREKPKKGSAKHEDVSPDRSPALQPTGAQAFLEMTIAKVDHAALEKAESSLGDLIQAASEDHCRLEGNLIVAELSTEQNVTLTKDLKKATALTILSRPSIATLDGQEAQLRVGGQIPLLRQEETVNGEPRRRIEFQDVGELIVIRPHVHEKDASRLTLDISATHTELDKAAELRTGDDMPRFITHQFKLEAETVVGKTLIITEREPKRGSGRRHSLLITILVQKVLPPVPVPSPWPVIRDEDARLRSEADVQKLRDENAVLHKRVEELQARLVDLEVQIRWLRAAAAPGGEDKVSDQEFLRRVYLDLMGILPTPKETRDFLSDENDQKRDKLIDKLLERKGADDHKLDEWKKWKNSLPSRPSNSNDLDRQKLKAQAEVDEALRHLDVRAAEAAVKAAQANHDRIQALRKAEAVSEADIDKARVDLYRAQSSLKAAAAVKGTKLSDVLLEEEAALKLSETSLADAEDQYEKKKGVTARLKMEGLKHEVIRRQAELDAVRAALKALQEESDAKRP